jgi:hypothetical protein
MWKGLVFVAGAIALTLPAGCAKAGPPTSMKGFRDAYAAEVRRRLPDSTIAVVSDDHLKIADGKGHDIDAYLDNAYAVYQQNPAHLQDVLKGYVSASIEAMEPTPIAAVELIILVRPAEYVQAQMATAGGSGEPGPLLFRPLAGDLVEIVAVDEPSTYKFLPASALRAALGLDDAKVWALALDNLRDEVASPDLTSRQVVALQLGGVASSLLVEPELWDSPSMQAGGAPVVAPVGKDLLLVTHEEDAKGIADMREKAREMRQDPDALSDRLFVRRKGAWVELDPSP